MLLCARALLLDGRHWIEGGALLIEGGSIRRVLTTRAEVRRARAARRVDCGDAVLTPGLVDAHAHLELTALAGRLRGTRSFADWIRALVRARAGLDRRAWQASLREGARRLLASGTTTVGDIDSSTTAARAGARLGLRLVVYRELLDLWDELRRARALAGVRRALPARARVREGLAPHAPYTTSDELLAAARALAGRRALPVAIHWAETEEEERWLVHGTGALAALLPRSPRRRGLARLDAAGLLGPRTALIHGNHPARGEPERLARAGVTLVHCPGSHAFFGRAPFPLERYRRAGVRVALGTDSLASNDELDMRREMALLRSAFPRLAPAEVFAMATEHGARALGGAALLAPGAPADVVAWSMRARGLGAALEELTAGRPAVERAWVAGRAARTP